MNIVILSKNDYAGSAFKMFSAIKRHTEHKIELYSGVPQNRLGHPINRYVKDTNRAEIQVVVNKADIIHFKGDWPIVDGYLGLTIPKKPIVVTTAGSFFRKKQYSGLGKYTYKDYERATLKTSFETDLLYPEYSDIWTPHPIDSDESPILWKHNGEPPVFMHIPSTPARKGTDFVAKVFSILRKKIECKTKIITGVAFKEAYDAKKHATIYFDQFVVGFYGNSALEAMQWGIPVVCWISPLALAQAKGKLEGCPIINEDVSDAERTANKVLEALEDPTLSPRTKEWCNRVHGYKAIAKLWDGLYRSIV